MTYYGLHPLDIFFLQFSFTKAKKKDQNVSSREPKSRSCQQVFNGTGL